MERAMSLAAVPDDDEMCLAGVGMWTPGRQLRAGSGVPVAWITDRTFSSAGIIWTDVSEESAESGLQPLLLSGMSDEPARPWDTGEQVGEPEDTEAIDGMDAAQVLEGWWDTPDEDEFAEDEELRAMFAPFGTRFPGLAPAVEEELDPELMRRAVFQYTREARIGLVPAARPADILARLGWSGACNHGITGSELAAVLRSWEDRFGARLLEVGFAGYQAVGQQAASDAGSCAADRRRALRVRRRGSQGATPCGRDCPRHREQPVLGLLVGLTPTASLLPIRGLSARFRSRSRR
jgi:hypothetical protein